MPDKFDMEKALARLEEAERRFRAGKPLARTVLDVQLSTAAAEAEIKGGGALDYPSPVEMLQAEGPHAIEREIGIRSGVVTVIMRWIARKILAVSSSPNIFEVSEPLALRLAATDLRGLTVEDLHLPFEAFVVTIPRGIIEIWSDDTGWHDCTMILVARGVWEKQFPRLAMAVYGEPNRASKTASDDAALTFSLPLVPGLDLAEAALLNRYPSKVQARRPDGTELTWTETSLFFAQFVANLCLYLSSPDPDVIQPAILQINKLKGKKGRKAQERRRKLQATRLHVVGSRQKMSREEREALRTGDTRSVAYKSLVRGHWRRQAYGPGRELRKIIWIAPHVRHKDLDTALHGHTYVLSKDREE